MTTSLIKTILISTVSFLLSFAIPIYVSAEINCSQDTVCIETKEGKNEMLFYAINKKEHKTSVTVDVKATGMSPSVKLPNTFVLKGKEKQLIFSLKYNKKAGVYNYSYSYGWVKGDSSAVHNDMYVYALPYLNNNKFKIAQSCNGSFSHMGEFQYAVDFSMPVNTAIHAARGGVVVDLKNNSSTGGASKAFLKKANYVLIEHSDGTLGEYGHLKFNGVAVTLGQTVTKRELIAYSGNSGYSTHPHLHFAVKSINKKGLSTSIASPFSTSDGTITCPPKNTYLSH